MEQKDLQKGNEPLAQSSADLRPAPLEDRSGHFTCSPGYVINGEYLVLDILGQGSFGRVFGVQSLTSPNKQSMALKVIQRIRKQSAEREIYMHSRLCELDPDGRRNLCVRMFDHFEHLGFSCILMEKLGNDLYEFCDHPFPMDQIRNIVHQLCSGVNFLHECGITHLDLKPANVAFKDSSYTIVDNVRRLVKTEIKILDISSSRFGIKRFEPAAVGTRAYMAPEMVLGLECWHPCDVWAIGCIAFELYTGKKLFISNKKRYSKHMLNKIHLNQMVRVCDEEIPPRMIENCSDGRMFRDGKLITMHSGKFKRLRTYMQKKDAYDQDLFELLGRMLRIDDERRVSLEQALEHTFFEGLAPAGN